MAERVVAAGVRMVVYDPEVVRAVATAAVRAGRVVPVHVKVETGNHRQGLEPADALALGRCIAGLAGVVLEGLSTHYADIEDTTDHRFAMAQVARFEATLAAFSAAGIAVPIASRRTRRRRSCGRGRTARWCASGIAAYGLWPSPRRTRRRWRWSPSSAQGAAGSCRICARRCRGARGWRRSRTCRPGAWVGYGRTFARPTTRASRILPVGYHEGYDRRLSNLAHMLVDGVRAPVRGRVCMNMAMIDVSDAPHAQVGTPVTLLGVAGDEHVSAEDLGALDGQHQLRSGVAHPTVA